MYIVEIGYLYLLLNQQWRWTSGRWWISKGTCSISQYKYAKCVSVLNLVALPPHGLLHYTHCCTPPQTTFPIIHCTDHTHTHTHTQLIALITRCTDHTAVSNHTLTWEPSHTPHTQLSPITRSPESHHTHHTQDIHFLFLPAEYCFACSILLMLAAYQAFTCLCSLSQCQLLYGAPPKFLSHFRLV